MSEPPLPNSDDAEEKLVFRGTLTEQDVLDLNNCRDLLMLGKGVRRLVIGFAFGISALFVVVVMLTEPHWLAAWPLAVTYLLLFGLPARRRAQIRRHYRTYADSYKESTVTISAQRVHIDNPDAKSDLDWKMIGIVAHTAEGMLFCTAELHVYFWLPNRLLTEESRKQVTDWAQRNGVKVRRL